MIYTVDRFRHRDKIPMVARHGNIVTQIFGEVQK